MEDALACHAGSPVTGEMEGTAKPSPTESLSASSEVPSWVRNADTLGELAFLTTAARLALYWGAPWQGVWGDGEVSSFDLDPVMACRCERQDVKPTGRVSAVQLTNLVDMREGST